MKDEMMKFTRNEISYRHEIILVYMEFRKFASRLPFYCVSLVLVITNVLYLYVKNKVISFRPLYTAKMKFYFGQINRN